MNIQLRIQAQEEAINQDRLDAHRPRSQVMERPPLEQHSSEESVDSTDQFPAEPSVEMTSPFANGSQIIYTPTSTLDHITPLTGFSSSQASWNSHSMSRSRGSTTNATALDGAEDPTPIRPPGVPFRIQRPMPPIRAISSTYNPQRKPPQFIPSHGTRQRSESGNRRRDPNAQYRAQEKAYIQQLRQNGSTEYFNEVYTPSLVYSTGSDSEEESPLNDLSFDNDNYDQEAQLFYSNDEILPSSEQLQIPENRERLEWHSMLASVLRGDVVKQEKQRLNGTTEQKDGKTLNRELWIGVRAKVCGRSIVAQTQLIEDGRANMAAGVEVIINFQIKGETEAGKPAAAQVRDVVEKIERIERLYPTKRAMMEAMPRIADGPFQASCDAVVAWHNTTELINTELAILQSWVGNDELDFAKMRNQSPAGSGLTDESSFLDRILKEDGLKSLQGDHSMLLGLTEVIRKAKTTLIQNAEGFAMRHLPPYIEELLILINFPSRLIQEVIRIRLQYARKMKDPGQQGLLMADQIITQFQILLKLAVGIKHDYTIVSQAEPGWDLPPCIDDTFDSIVLDALQFYFKMLNSKLVMSKNTFKEAEILEQEWGFCNEIGRYLEGGDVEVAEQFSSLTAKSLQRLTAHFERQLLRRPEENDVDMDKRYKQILDSVRVRQRKLFRFSRLLGECFENASEYNIDVDGKTLESLCAGLIASGHFLVYTSVLEHKGIFLIASPTLVNRPRHIQSILGTSYHATDSPEDPSNPYILILRPEEAMVWDGKQIEIDLRSLSTDIRPGRLRLVADGSLLRLQNARASFLQATGVQLDVLTELRANLPRVSVELNKIKKTTYKLSNTIMESVEIIRKQTRGLENQELIQTCFAFATEFGMRSVGYMDVNRRLMNNVKLTRLALDWVSFICDDCIASDRKTFKWAVVALEFAMAMTRGPNILAITGEEYTLLQLKVSGCMSLLISHFDIMGARSTLAALAEKQRLGALTGQLRKLDISKMKTDDEAAEYVRAHWCEKLAEIDDLRRQRETDRWPCGRVLEDASEADRSLTSLSSSADNMQLRWQQGQFVGGGTFGSVYAAINLDSGHLMAVKEIRLQDPQLIPTIAGQIRDEMGVLEVLDHPNIVSYYGIEVHRDKVYIFMEYCSGGSLANLLEHGRIEDEIVVQVYALQMLEGLAYLHASSIIHRDIKPENILLDHNGIIKYVDFGAAKIIARQGKTLAGDINGGVSGKQKSMTGTPMYMSPEVIKGHNEGRQGAIDVWSLGCVILEMCTGRRPWASLDNEWAIMYNIAQGNPPQLPTRDQLSDEGIDFLKRCFEKDPRRRASAAELLQCKWMLRIRRQVALGADSDMSTPTSSDGSLSATSSRVNSNTFL